jgi:hypothetical protein
MPLLSWDDLHALPVGEGSLIEEYLFWFSLATLLKPRSILEVGTSSGVSALILLWGASLFDSVARLTTIDIARPPHLEANFAKLPALSNRIDFLQGDSREILARLADEHARFDLVLLDGSHEYDHVRIEWSIVEQISDMWIIHDTDQFPGPARVVREIEQGGGHSVWSLQYPMGHQVHDVVAQAKRYHGLYHQRALPWTKTDSGPGMTLIKRRRSDAIAENLESGALVS